MKNGVSLEREGHSVSWQLESSEFSMSHAGQWSVKIHAGPQQLLQFDLVILLGCEIKSPALMKFNSDSYVWPTKGYVWMSSEHQLLSDLVSSHPNFSDRVCSIFKAHSEEKMELLFYSEDKNSTFLSSWLKYTNFEE